MQCSFGLMRGLLSKCSIDGGGFRWFTTIFLGCRTLLRGLDFERSGGFTAIFLGCRTLAGERDWFLYGGFTAILPGCRT